MRAKRRKKKKLAPSLVLIHTDKDISNSHLDIPISPYVYLPDLKLHTPWVFISCFYSKRFSLFISIIHTTYEWLNGY